MIKFQLKINPAKLYLPSAVRKMPVSDRLDAAIVMNDNFCKSLKYEFEDRKISPKVFKTALQKATQSKIKVEISPMFDNSHPVCPIFNEKGESLGYFIRVPFMKYEKKISQSNMLQILKITQNFFDDIFNPKFFARKLAMYKKGYDMKPAAEFFENHIKKTRTKLNMSALNKFLQPMSDDEKIDNLQLLRYCLIKEQNTDRYAKHFMLQTNKNPQSDIKYSSDAIFSNTYYYPEKLKEINRKLNETIKSAREKF